MDQTLKDALEKFRKDVQGVIDGMKAELKTLIDEQKTSNDSAIKSIVEEKLPEFQKALDKTNEQLATAQTMGIHTNGGEDASVKKQWEDAGGFTAFFRAMYERAAAGVAPSLSGLALANPWERCKGIQELCIEAARKRKIETDSFGAIVRQHNASDGSEGGFFIPDSITAEYIDIVRAQTPIMNMPGVMILSGLIGDLPIPRVTSGLTGYHLGEREAPTESTLGVGLKWLRPKKVGGYTRQSNRLLYQTQGVVEAIIKNALSRDVSLEMNRGLLNGTGTANEGLGLLNSTTGMTTTIGGSAISPTTIRRFTSDDAAQMDGALDAADELRDTPTYGFLCHPITLNGLKRERIIQYSGQNRRNATPAIPGMLLMSKAQIEEQIGYPFKTTTQFPATTSGNDVTTAVLFGDWSLFWIGQWRSPIFKVSDVASNGTNSAFLQDELWMVMFMEYDCQLLRNAAFSIYTNAQNATGQWAA